MIKSSVSPETAEAAKSRSNLYSLFSGLFLSEVTPGLLDILRSGEISSALKELGADLELMISESGQEGLLNSLAEEYAALFIVPGGVHPYESVRLEGQLNQKSAFGTEEFYKKSGLIISDGISIMPDHIGTELMFMSYLAGKEAASLNISSTDNHEKWLSLQKEFFEAHISRWAFSFLQDLEKYAFHPFYKSIARLTSGFLETERESFMEKED